ncbi:MAG: hypothetical protein B6U94_01810 [Thermofilum sp. ex4484_79]|nr:MAG: hypothetical protein B6U94_01810 [Thermofilum sp. ex4484_79]
MSSYLWNWMLNIALSFGGYAGIFVISILGNVIPLMPIPYLALVFIYTAYFPADPLLVGIVSGIGGGIGKLAIYFLSRGASRLLSDKQLKQLDAFRRLIGNYGALAVFIFAATPSPDDIAIAVLGVARYSILKFFIAITLGKIVISLITASFGKMFSLFVNPDNLVISMVITLVLFIVTTWIIFKIDWISVFEIVSNKGWKHFIRDILKGNYKDILSK